MFAPPFSSMLPVFSNNHSELNAGAPVSGVACPVQAKQYFTNLIAAVSELFAALLKVVPQFVRNDLCVSWRSA
jgi:hypothetical protein